MTSTPILPEVWTLVGTHLPPRHLNKLLRVSKQISSNVDNHDYWTLVAAQLIWRDCASMEIHPCGTCEFDVMPRADVDLYDIPRTDGDYRYLMRRFLARMEEMRDTYTKGAQKMLDEKNHVCLFGNNDHYPDWWNNTFAQPLHTRNVTFFLLSAWQHAIKIKNDEARITQKELARRVTAALVTEKHSVDSTGETLRHCAS
jgi:hypothetical protein